MNNQSFEQANSVYRVGLQTGKLPGGSQRFTETDKSVINQYWNITCDFIKTEKNTRLTCPEHGIQHKRTPDTFTYEQLYKMFPTYPMEAWAEVFFVTREAIRLLHWKTFQTSFGQDRKTALFGTSPDMEKINEYAKFLYEKPKHDKRKIADWLDISEGYIKYWRNRNDDVAKIIEHGESKRQEALTNPTVLKCYRCHIQKPVSEFHKSKKTRHGYTATCKQCSVAGVVYHYEKRKAEFDITNLATEKKCTVCKRIRHREHFHISKAQSGGLQSTCISCSEKHALEHPKRKQKFIDAGFTAPCLCKTCEEYLEPYKFYLIKPNPRYIPELTLISQHCRDCIKDVARKNKVSFMSLAQRMRTVASDFGKISPEIVVQKILHMSEKPKNKVYSWENFMALVEEE